MIALLLLAAPGLDTLRERSAVSAAAAVQARTTAQDSVAKRTSAERELAARKKEVEEGHGGWLGERRVRAQSATVRDLAEASIAAERAASDAEARAAAARESLRGSLFADAGAKSADGDGAARAGRADEAQRDYREAAASLAEASGMAATDDDADPWRGLDSEIPLAGDESPSERASVGAAYRRAAELVTQRLGGMRARLAAMEPAVAAWNRLSRFRGVLERAGAAAADPTPERDRLAASIERGDALEARLRQRAAAALSTTSPIVVPSAEPTGVSP